MDNVGNTGCRSKGTGDNKDVQEMTMKDVSDPEKQGMSPPLSLQDKKVGFAKAIILVYA